MCAGKKSKKQEKAMYTKITVRMAVCAWVRAPIPEIKMRDRETMVWTSGQGV